MIEAPKIDLGSMLPVAGLAVIAIVCIVALLLRSILHSRVALFIAIVGAVVIVGPMLAGSLTQIVWALAPLGVMTIVGGVMVMWLLHRNPDLRELWREGLAAIGKRNNQGEPPPTIIDQPKAVTHPARRRLRSGKQDISEWW